MAGSQDRISALPANVRVRILSFLPDEEAQKTALLSKTWRYVWKYVEDLSLEEMTLHGDSAFYDGHFAGRFPALKVLKLDLLKIFIPRQDLMEKVFAACPVLEDLKFTFDLTYCDIPKRTFNVCLPTLKRLYVEVVLDTFLIGYSHGFVVKAPKLEYIKICDDALLSYKVDPMPYLRKATVKVGHCSIRFKTSHVDAGYPFQILSRITNTRSLVMSVHTVAALISFSKELPQFLNLTRLKLAIHVYFGWNLLTRFLENSPILEFLKIIKEPACFSGDEESNEGVEEWNAPQLVPSCLSRIKEIEIKYMEGLGTELKGVKYLLMNATVLEKMVVHPDPDSGSKQQCQRILKFPKASENCQIEII